MIILISQRHKKTERGFVDTLENSYIRYYEKFGLTLVPVPNVSSNISSYSENIKIGGIILTGGDDVSPNLYKGRNLNENYSKERDKTEAFLIKMSIARKIPLLAACRGTQMLNVFFGGRLLQKINDTTGVNHVATRHKVKIVDKKALALYKKKEFVVNSYHNHGINKETISNKLKAFAESEDGIIEGLYHPKYPIAGILWHPERAGSDIAADKSFVKSFVERKFFWSL